MTVESVTAATREDALIVFEHVFCNFINAYGDRFTPKKDWEAETQRNVELLYEAWQAVRGFDVVPRHPWPRYIVAKARLAGEDVEAYGMKWIAENSEQWPTLAADLRAHLKSAEGGE